LTYKNIRTLAKEEEEEEEALKALTDIINNPSQNYLDISPFLRKLHGIEAVDPSNSIFDKL